MRDDGRGRWELQTTTEFAPATRAVLRRQALILWHRTKSAVSRGGIKAVALRLVYVVAYLSLPVASAIKLGFSRLTAGALVTLIWAQGRKAWKENAPKNMQFLERNYLERKFALSRLIIDMHRQETMSPSEVQDFREEALRVIAQYVRDHRADWKGRSIFANLLVEDRDELVVIARNEPHRMPMARYPRSELAAAGVFETGRCVVVGDLDAEHPNSTGKSYKSILILPIYLDDKIAGALSIDSEEKYHFDGEAESLWDCLLPYVSLLAWTLSPKRVKGSLAVNNREASR